MNTKKIPTIVIFGRANTGKSTLFNRLTEKNQALVSCIEGTTRDSNIAEMEWGGYKMKIIDTGGIINFKNIGKKQKINEETDEIEIKVQEQALAYLKSADLILFLLDGQAGLMEADKIITKFIQRREEIKNKTLLVVNKIDGPKFFSETAQFNKLNLGEPVSISAGSGSGTGDLLDIILKKLKNKKKKAPKKETDKEFISVAIIGKPNVGKSSLLNSLLGYERVIVSKEAHTTREPQDTIIQYKDKLIKLIDTAGISKKGQKTKGLEKIGIAKSLSSLKKADIALLIIDINEEITRQDSKLVAEIIDKQKGLVIIANKWDLIEEKNTKKYQEKIRYHFPFANWVPIHFSSALSGSKVQKIFDLILEIDKTRKMPIIKSSGLDKFLKKIIKIHRPAKDRGEKIPRIYEILMTETNPPCFDVRIGAKDSLLDSYVRFIENQLRKKFGFEGTSLKIKVVKNKQVHGQHEKEPFSDNKKELSPNTRFG